MDEPCERAEFAHMFDDYARKSRDICYKMAKERNDMDQGGGGDHGGDEDDEEVLTMKHLKLTFIYWAVGIGASVLAFVIEIIFDKTVRGN